MQSSNNVRNFGMTFLYNGKEVYNSQENKAFEYTFLETGTYRIMYKVTDDGGLSLSPSYQVDIIEYEAPAISFNKNFKEQVKQGETYQLPNYTVSDNVTENPIVFVTVVTPTCNVKKVEDNKITFEEKGKYIVRYFVYDDFYNFVLKEFVIYAI